MEINRYIAWDGNEYQGQPPAGWYQASDGRWWPEGYGPPPTPPQPDDEFRTAPVQAAPTTGAVHDPVGHGGASGPAEGDPGAGDGQRYQAVAEDRTASLAPEVERVGSDGSVPYQSESGPVQHQAVPATDKAGPVDRPQRGQELEELAPLEFPWSPPRITETSDPVATGDGSTTAPNAEPAGPRAANTATDPEPDELAATQATIAESTGVSIEASRLRADGPDPAVGRYEQSDHDASQSPGTFPGPVGSGGTGARRDAIAERARSRFDQMSERINESRPRANSRDADPPAGQGFRTVHKPLDEASTTGHEQTDSLDRDRSGSANFDTNPPVSSDPSVAPGAAVSGSSASADPSVSSDSPVVPVNTDMVAQDRVNVVDGAPATEQRVATIQTGSMESASAVQARLAEVTTTPSDQSSPGGDPRQDLGQPAAAARPRTASDLFNNLTGRSSNPADEVSGPVDGVEHEIVDTHEPADPAAAVSLAAAAAAATALPDGAGGRQPQATSTDQPDQNYANESGSSVKEPSDRPEPVQAVKQPILDAVQRDTPTLELPLDQLVEGDLPEGITRLPASDMAGLRATSNPEATVGVEQIGPLDAPTANPFHPGYEPGSSASSLSIEAPPSMPQVSPEELKPPENGNSAPASSRVGSPGDFSAPVVPGASMAPAPESDRTAPVVPGLPTYESQQAYPNTPGDLDRAGTDDRGSRKGLKFMGIALILLVVGILVYLGWLFYTGQGFMADLGSQSEPPAETTIGSVSDPYDSSQAVSLYYEADGAEQRWAVKSEPLSEAEAEPVSAADAGDGYELVGVNLIVVFQSGSESRNIDELVFKAVDTNGMEYDAVACPGGEGLPSGLVVAGQRVSGAVCWAVPFSSVDGLMLGIQSTQVSSTVHIRMPINQG